MCLCGVRVYVSVCVCVCLCARVGGGVARILYRDSARGKEEAAEFLERWLYNLSLPARSAELLLPAPQEFLWKHEIQVSTHEYMQAVYLRHNAPSVHTTVHY